MDEAPSQEPSPSASNSPRNSPSPTRDPVRDPACDQCRIRKVRCNRQHPKCSNCKKAKVPCGFSNRGKRVNHTKQLVSDVEVLGKRLDRIETAMSKCVETIEKLTPALTQHTRIPSTELTAEMPLISGAGTNAENDASPGSAGEFDPTNRHRVVDRGGHERFYGFSSMYSLYAEAKAASEELLSPSAPSTRANGTPESDYTQAASETPTLTLLTAHDSSFPTKLQGASDLLQNLSTNTQNEITSDGLPLALPPRSILDTFLDPYLANLNPILPIFSKATLLAAIDAQYNPQNVIQDPAWVVCFNNIILQTLNVKSGFDKKSRNLTRNTMDEDFFMSFLMNAQRCFANIEKLMKPRLVNVQALLSMALVALNHFCFAVFEMIFAQACQLAKSIGLHQQDHDSPDSERINLFWTLFIIDKQLPFICGKSCHLHTFDCDVPLPEPAPNYPLFEHFMANIRMAYLQEDIYRSLYSAEASRITDSQRQLKVADILEKLKVWSTTYQHLELGINPDSACQKPYFGLELKYSLLTSRILVQRRSKDKDARQQRLIDSRESLNIIRTLCDARSAIGGHIVLERLLIHHPMLCYFELYINLLQDFKNDCTRDVEAMSYVVEGLAFQEARRLPNSYGGKLKTATTVCTSIATTIKSTKEMKNTEHQVMYPGTRPPDNQSNAFESSSWPPLFFQQSHPLRSGRPSLDNYVYDVNNPMLDSTDPISTSNIFLPRKDYSPPESGYLQNRNFAAPVRPQAAPSTNSLRYSYPNDQMNFGIDQFPTSSSSTSINSLQQPRTQGQKSPVLFETSPDQLDLTNFLGGFGNMGSIWNEDEGRNFDIGMSES